MRRFTSIFLALAFSSAAHAAPLTWALKDFKFDDGGTAYGTFTYDSVTNQLSDIDVYTTAGSKLAGRHFVAPAGEWGAIPDHGTLAFSDVAGPDFMGAGWFRIDANIDFKATPGTVVNQTLDLGAESFCMNTWCSSAANEITSPGQSRRPVSGYLLAIAAVPEPSTLWLSGLALAAVGLARRARDVRVS